MDKEKAYYIVTGATGGIGRAICKRLVALGKNVIATCRNTKRGATLIDELRATATPDADIRCETLLLDDCRSITDFARRMTGTHIVALINNAGVMNRDYRLTDEGVELTMAVNHLGTVLLTRMMLPTIAYGGSVVFTTSVTRRLHHTDPHMLYPKANEFSQLGTYGRSKLALTHYAMHLADEQQGQLHINCADPGVVNSGMITMHRWFDPLADMLFRPFISSPNQGATSAIAAVQSPLTGMIYYHSSHHAIDKELRRDAAHEAIIAATDEWIKRHEEAATRATSPCDM